MPATATKRSKKFDQALEQAIAAQVQQLQQAKIDQLAAQVPQPATGAPAQPGSPWSGDVAGRVGQGVGDSLSDAVKGMFGLGEMAVRHPVDTAKAAGGYLLDRLVPHQWPEARIPDLSPTQQRNLDKTAQRLEQLGQLRASSKRESVYFGGKSEPKSVFVVTPAEATPGTATGSLLDMLAAPYDARQRLTSAVSGALSDNQGIDLINKGLRIGNETLPTRSMTGAYRPDISNEHGPWLPPDTRPELEGSPGYAIVNEVPLNKRGQISKLDDQKLRTAATARATFDDYPVDAPSHLDVAEAA